MNGSRWDRRPVIEQLRSQIWRHLTQSARSDDDVLLDAAALLQMPASDVRALARLQFILSREVEELLREMPILARRLTTTSAEELEMSADRVRGPIRWPATLAARSTTGLPHLFATAPARRAFATPENELLVFALEAIRSFGRKTGWHKSTSATVGAEVRRRVHEATRWQHMRALADIPVRPPSIRTISRVRSRRGRRRYQSVINVIELYRRFLARLDREAIRDAIERYALVASQDHVLLELLCTFTAIDALHDLGWHSRQRGLMRSHVLHATRGVETLDLFYQHTPAELSTRSRYREIQRAHGLSPGGLIPDLVVHVHGPASSRWVMIEVKGVQRAVAESVRAATQDLLAYRRAFSPTLDAQKTTYGVGVGWGRGLEPAPGGEILLCSPDTLPQALAAVV